MGGGLIATRVGGALWRNILSPLDAPIMKATNGRVRIVGLPVVSLTITGARTGLARESMLAYFTDGDDVLVVASNWGQQKNPGWYYNLVTHPECELHIGSRGGRFTAQEITGAERDELYRLAAARLSRSWTTYEHRNNGVRAIPMMRLTPCHM
jgi:deazaflavin-dependent oxidoreductase (nitroreductase family)